MSKGWRKVATTSSSKLQFDSTKFSSRRFRAVPASKTGFEHFARVRVSARPRPFRTDRPLAAVRSRECSGSAPRATGSFSKSAASTTPADRRLAAWPLPPASLRAGYAGKTVFHRFDCVLAPTKAKVLAEFELNFRYTQPLARVYGWFTAGTRAICRRRRPCSTSCTHGKHFRKGKWRPTGMNGSRKAGLPATLLLLRCMSPFMQILLKAAAYGPLGRSQEVALHLAYRRFRGLGYLLAVPALRNWPHSWRSHKTHACRFVEATSVKQFGRRTTIPAGAVVHFHGDDPEDGPLLRYTVVTRAMRRAA